MPGLTAFTKGTAVRRSFARRRKTRLHLERVAPLASPGAEALAEADRPVPLAIGGPNRGGL